MILPINFYNNKKLRIKCKEIYVINDYMINIINNMFDTMYHNNAVGLAAPQIGKNSQIFIIDNSIFNKTCKRVFINPEIVEFYGKTWKLKEGCLSFPFFKTKIKRYEFIKISYCNKYMEKCEEIFQGFSSRVIQHEYDHLKGKLFIDYLK